MALPSSLVDGSWLAGVLSAPGPPQVRVVDVRWYLDERSGLDAYRAGHIPGAVWLDIDRDLSGPPGPGTGRHPLPDPSVFRAALARAGIGPTTAVVAYDDAGGSIAARLWWMLHTCGRPAAVLDGGLAAWPGSLESGEGSGESKGASSGGEGEVGGGAETGWPADAIVDGEGLEQLRLAPGVVVLDARSAERYRGDPNPADPRPGHIPGAASAPWSGNLDPVNGCFGPPEALRARYEALGIRSGTTVVASCGSGITACHDLLALHVAGFAGDLRLYPGSWSAWASDPNRPVVSGPEPA